MSDATSGEIILGDGVLETVIAFAVKEISGVANIGSTSASEGIRSVFSAKPSTSGIEIVSSKGTAEDAEQGTKLDDDISIAVHIDILYGYAFKKIAEDIRSAVASAVETQIGVRVSAVDVYIDGIKFSE